MKLELLLLGIFAVGLGLCSCQSVPPRNQEPVKTFNPTRISDDYRNRDVQSYEVYEWPVRQHCMAMVTLKSGMRMPLLCRQEANQIYAIPQSVFTTSDVAKFLIMCEPRIDDRKWQTYALMRISVRSESDGLVNGRRRVSKITPKPTLIELPALR